MFKYEKTEEEEKRLVGSDPDRNFNQPKTQSCTKTTSNTKLVNIVNFENIYSGINATMLGQALAPCLSHEATYDQKKDNQCCD